MSKGKSIFDRIGHGAQNAQEGLRVAGMDYLVKRVQLQGDGGNGVQDVRGAFGLFTSKGTFLKNAVGDEYRVVQHAEQMQVVDNLVAQGKCSLRTVGALSERTAFAWADLPIVTEVRPGDPVQWGMLMTSSHGATANHAFLMAERLRCVNMMPRLNRGNFAGVKVTLRHSGDVQHKLSKVQALLNAALAEANVEAALWRNLVERKIDRKDARKVIEQWLGVEEAREANNDRKVADLLSDATLIEKCVEFSPGNTGDSSLWELLNGMTYFLDHQQQRHKRAVAAAQRFAASAVDGVLAKRRERALDLVKARA